jgi:hypothetical protein
VIGIGILKGLLGREAGYCEVFSFFLFLGG